MLPLDGASLPRMIFPGQEMMSNVERRLAVARGGMLRKKIEIIVPVITQCLEEKYFDYNRVERSILIQTSYCYFSYKEGNWFVTYKSISYKQES